MLYKPKTPLTLILRAFRSTRPLTANKIAQFSNLSTSSQEGILPECARFPELEKLSNHELSNFSTSQLDNMLYEDKLGLLITILRIEDIFQENKRSINVFESVLIDAIKNINNCDQYGKPIAFETSSC